MMAPKVHADKLDVLKVPPQWGEREVRRLLRGLRRPHTLEMEPLAKFLCDAYGVERPYDACLHFVHETFVNKGLIGKRLYYLIRTCDVEANETLLAAASDMGVSPRQFFRYRREAIVALVAHANQLGLAHPAPTGLIEELARLLGETDPNAASRVYEVALSTTESVSLDRVDAWLNAGAFFDDTLLDQFRGIDRLRALIKIARACFIFGNTRAGDVIVESIRARMVDAIVEDREVVEFELLHLEYVRALHRESTGRCAQLAREARRAAEGDAMRTIAAILIESESAIRVGDLVLAEQALTAAEGVILARKQVRLVSILVCGRAAIAFMQGDLSRALAYAASAQLALSDRLLDALTLNAFIGRVTLAMGLPWRAPRDLLAITNPPVRVITPSRATGLVALDGSTRRLFQRLYLEIVDLRAALVAGDLESIDAIVDVLTLTRQTGYRCLEAASLALISVWLERTGARDEAQRNAVAAWEISAELGDFFSAQDLFDHAQDRPREFGAVDLDRLFLAAFYRSLTARFPDASLTCTTDGPAKDAFWRSILLRALRDDGSAAAEDDAFVAALLHGQHRNGYQKHRAAFCRAVARDVAILLPACERTAFAARLTRLLEAFYERMPGASHSKRPQF
jgi:hypothetical protein